MNKRYKMKTLTALAAAILMLSCGKLTNNDMVSGRGDVSGIILKADGSRAAGASVYVYDYPSISSTTPNDGSFVLKNVPAGKRRFIASLGEAAISFEAIVIAGSETEVGQIQLAQAGKISGKVSLDFYIEMVATIKVLLAGTELATLVQSPPGDFVISRVPAGCYTLRAEHDDCEPHEEQVCLGNGEEKDVGEIVLKRTVFPCSESSTCPAGMECRDGNCVIKGCEPALEVCDGRDNDCDGQIDEGSLTAPCPGVDKTEVGECTAGYVICVDGRWSNACFGTVDPAEEVCDGLDNDCDGETDEIENCSRMVDVLFVVDNSGSMAEEQEALAQAFQHFAQKLDETRIDYQIGVTTTDMNTGEGLAGCTCPKENPEDAECLPDYEKRWGGKLVAAPGVPGILRPPAGRQSRSAGQADQCDIPRPGSTDELVSWFASNVHLGIDGCGFEKGLEASRAALSSPLTESENECFLRENAILAVIWVTDEEDCSHSDEAFTESRGDECITYADRLTPVEDYRTFLLGLKGGDAARIRVAGLVGAMYTQFDRNTWTPISVAPADCRLGDDGLPAYVPGNCDPTQQGACTAGRYASLISSFGGFLDSICQTTYARTMEDFASYIVSGRSGIEIDECGEEVCDEKDNDCDGLLNEGLDCPIKSCLSDADCRAADMTTVCGWEGYCRECAATCVSDADCSSGFICLPYGNGCTACMHETCQDADGDGYWTTWARNPEACPLTWRGWDCDDEDAAVHPGATEICDGRDEDCDGHVDSGPDGPACSVACTSDEQCAFSGRDAGSYCDTRSGYCVECWATCASDPDCQEDDFCLYFGNGCTGCFPRTCEDYDLDGFYNYSNCLGVADCNDYDPNSYPGAPEVCDGRDNDCDYEVEECPQPLIDIQVTPVLIDFGEIPVIQQHLESATITITSAAPEYSSFALTVNEIALDNNDGFSLDGVPDLPLFMPPGQTATFTVFFHPIAIGLNKAKLAIRSDDPDEPVVYVTLRGEGLAPGFRFQTTDTLEFELEFAAGGEASLHIVKKGSTLGSENDCFEGHTVPWGTCEDAQRLSGVQAGVYELWVLGEATEVSLHMYVNAQLYTEFLLPNSSSEGTAVADIEFIR